MRPTHGLAALRWAFDLALIASVVAVLAALVVARGLPAWGHPTLVITGGSMEPAIPKGAVVVLDPVAPTDLRPGDIVTVRIASNATHVTHRIVDVAEVEGASWLRTKGDANPTADPALLPADQVVGRVGSWIPALGYLVRLLSVPQGVAFMLAFAFALYASARLIEELEIELHRGRRARVASGSMAWRLVPDDGGPTAAWHLVPDGVGPAGAAPVVPADTDPAVPADPAVGPDPALAALVVRRPAPDWGPRSSAGWSPRASGPGTAAPDATIASAITAADDGTVGLDGADSTAIAGTDLTAPEPTALDAVPSSDPAGSLSPAARRAYRHRASRRRSARAGGLA